MSNHYLEIEEIREIHLELTEKCNASCPMCARNLHGSIENPYLDGHQLGIDFFEERIDWDSLKSLKHVMLCGTYGDPIAAKDCRKIVRLLKQKNVESVYLYTNGGLRSEIWWHSLGQILNGDEDLVVFGIDGLSDTNHLYRRGVNWEKLVANIRAFIAGGGKARWDFLVFRHNQHQIEAAKKFATELGVQKFRVRKTSRFSNPSVRSEPQAFKVLRKQIGKDEFARLAKKEYREEEVEYNLHQPTIQKYANEATNSDLPKILQRYGTFDEYMDKAEISCIYREKFKRIFISADGKVWPCSYVGGDRKTWNLVHVYRDDIKKNVLERYGEEFNSLKSNSLNNILNHDWFAEKLVGSFSEKTKIGENPRLLKCARTCGKMFNPILSQSEDQPVQKVEANADPEIFFLSFDEKDADRNWRKLKRRFPKAKRVHGIQGIFNAHKECANQSSTPFFFVVDGDNELLPNFKFDISALDLEEGAVYVWRSLNPVNGLVYGYGGLKLFSKSLFQADMPNEADMSTTIANGRYVVVDELAGITHFNSSPFNAWRGAFRECAKLAASTIRNQNQTETNQRLYTWKYKWSPGAKYGDWCLRGAKAGAAYGFQFATNKATLSKINDFAWLSEKFEQEILKDLRQKKWMPSYSSQYLY